MRAIYSKLKIIREQISNSFIPQSLPKVQKHSNMLIDLTRVIAASQTRLLAGNQIVITETRLAQGRAGRMVTRLDQGRAGTMEGVTALYN